MNEVFIWISVVLLAGYSTLMLYYYAGWLRTPRFNASGFAPETKVSIVIAARNEEQNIWNCVRSILQQDYPKELMEVIVVDDHSLTPFPEERGVRALSLPSNLEGKKEAIAFGIQHSTGNIVITTDADCVAGKNWLSTLVSYYEQFHPKMIAAPVAFSNETSWLEKWQSLDLCGMTTITAGAITNGFPNMCSGANLAYEKKVFEEVGGFAGIDKQPSGDDVMLMQKIAIKYPGGVHFLKSNEAIVLTKAVKTFTELFHQRIRWLSKGTAFPDWRVSAVLVFSWLFNLSFVINFIGGFFRWELWLMAGIAFLLKTLFELPLLLEGCSFFGKRNLILYILPVQALHILYVVLAGGMSRFYQYNWKGRSYSNRLNPMRPGC